MKLHRFFLLAFFSAVGSSPATSTYYVRERQIASYDPREDVAAVANVVQIPPVIEVPNAIVLPLSSEDGPANPELSDTSEENYTAFPTASPTKAPTKVPTTSLLPTESTAQLLTSSSTTQPIQCEGYFCDKTLGTMFLFMTHNSYAVRWEIFSPNQNKREGQQFDDGIRGFNWDVYYQGDGYLVVDHTPDENTWSPKEYNDGAEEIMDRLERDEYRNEIVVIIIEHKKGQREANPFLVEPFGNKIITNYDPTKPFSYYIAKGQQVLMLGKYRDPVMGMHVETEFVTQNQYLWVDASEDPNLAYRNGPKNDSTTAKLMNHFCGTSILDGSVGNMLSSAIVNDPYRILSSSRMFAKQEYAMGSLPNIIIVDFYETGDIWPAQALLRDRIDSFGDELSDGTRCVAKTTCNNCYNPNSYWDTKAMTACGSEPCWGESTICANWITCNNCCAGNADCPWYQFGICTCL